MPLAAFTKSRLLSRKQLIDYMTEIDALLFLTFIPYLGNKKIRLLIDHFGSALAALEASKEGLAELPGFGKTLLESWAKGPDEKRLQENERLIERLKAKVIPFTSEDYPSSLLKINDFPILLYVRGACSWNSLPSAAIVGTRAATIYGMEMAEKISAELATKGVLIISGLARGIDTAAHLAALKKGATIAVLGSGLNSVYPTENQRLSEEIIENGGAIISEFAMNEPPARSNFPKRNRIVSGMAGCTVVIEAPLSSGAMLTAECALEQTKPLYALPGRADIENFKGNHALIKSGKAKLIESAADLSDIGMTQTAKQQTSYAALLSEEENTLLSRLPKEEFYPETLYFSEKISIQKLNGLLMSLVLKKVIKEYPGKIYKKV